MYSNFLSGIWSLSQNLCLSLLLLYLLKPPPLELDKEDKCTLSQAMLFGFTEHL